MNIRNFSNALRRGYAWRTISTILLFLGGAAHAVIPAPTDPPLNLDSWSFFDVTNWATDFGNLPVTFTNLSASNLGNGNALVVHSTNTAWLQYSLNPGTGTNELSLPTGTIMFWYAPAWISMVSTNPNSTGPGVWGRLVDVGGYSNSAGWFSLFLDPQGTNIYFATQTNNGSGATVLSAPVSFDITNYWHHICLSYGTASNTALYIDGVVVTNGPPLTYLPGPGVSTFNLGSDATGIDQMHGMMDDVYTYNYQLDAVSINDAYQSGVPIYLMTPLNQANLVGLTSAPSSPVTAPVFEAITGWGYLHTNGVVTNCITSTNVWFTNVTAKVTTNGVTVTFTIAGGVDGYLYDVFATAGVQSGLRVPITNCPFAWMGQGPRCTSYQLTLGVSAAYLILGTPQDTDGDGLTDAYENLVSHTDPLNPDTFGVGMSDGWQIAYFGYAGLDPYSDPFNNGWLLIDEFNAGLNPLVYNQPPAPSGLTATYSNTTATVTWNFANGGVTGYKLEKYDPVAYQTNDITLSATTNRYLDLAQQVLDDDLTYGAPLYRMQAQYGSTPSAWTGWVPLYKPDPVQYWGSGYFVRGFQGQNYLAVPPFPPNASTARIVFANTFFSSPTSWTVSVTSFTNNCYLLPPQLMPDNLYDGLWFLEVRDSNSNLLGTIDLSYTGFQSGPFYDGRQELQQNLSFLLRAADASSPFQFEQNFGWTNAFFRCSANYAAASYVEFALALGDLSLDELSPFKYNYLYRNFAFSPDDLNWNGTLDSAYYDAVQGFYLPGSPVYEAQGPTNAVLSPTDFPWSFFRPYYTNNAAELSRIGVSYGGGGFTLSSAVSNIFGLRFESVKTAYNTNGVLYTNTISRGGTVPDYGNILYPATAQPTLVTTNYYFGRRFIDSLPGDGVFSPTNTTPILIAPLGQPFWLAGYAKQRISNGDPTKFGYLGQYFAWAYKMDTNGVVTTNQTGILSEYGEFFPTEPGPTALITMTNWGVNERGTAVVNVVSLCVDANHDGTMDQTLSGADSTSFLKPFRFWINNDNDGTGVGADTYVVGNIQPDYIWGQIRSQRNLEDFARLWVCGLPQLPPSQGYTITLSMSPSSGNPTINLYAAITNSAAYLSDPSAATAQFTQLYLGNQLMFDYSRRLGTISPSQSYNLPLGSDGTPQYTNFLFEGTNIGAGQLTLTISQTTAQGSNVLAQTSAWLDLHDVKEFYEQAAITNSINNLVAFQTTGIEIVRHVSSSALGNDNDIIVLVHGFNVSDTAWLIQSDTVFKRLYWAGYHGKFATVRWPCKILDTDISTFNISENEAYTASASMTAYLNQLRARFPGHHLHLLAHSQGNAVVSEAIRNGAPFDTYILTQAAISASAYDINAPVDTDITAYEVPPNFITPEWQPMGYHGIYTNRTGRIVSFFNTVDFALATGTVGPLPANWEVNQEKYKPSPGYSYDGTNAWANLPGISKYQVTDTQESRAMISRSRTKAIGALGPSSGQTTQGVVQSTIDLHSQFGFSDALSEHSAQWTRPIQTSRPYFQQVLTSAGMQPAP